MRQFRLASIVATVAVVVGLLTTAVLYAQRTPDDREGGPPQGRGGFTRGGGFQMQAMIQRAVHGSWAFVSFELGVSDEKLVELRGVYQKNWEGAKETLDKLEDTEPDGRRELMQSVMVSQRELREHVKVALTDEQGAKLDEWYERQRQGAMRGGGGGGRGGGRGPDGRGDRGGRPRER